MSEYKSELKADPKDANYAVLIVTDENGNFGQWFMKKMIDNYRVVSFMEGKVGKTEFRGDIEDRKWIVKSGRGRAPQGALEQMQAIEKEVYRQYV